MPTQTATIATEIVASSSRAAELRNASRSVRTVATRCRSLTSRTVRACRRARPYATSTGSPRMTSTKCPDSAASVRQRRFVASAVEEPMSAANSGSSGTVSTGMAAVIGSSASIATIAAGGRKAAATSVGR